MEYKIQALNGFELFPDQVINVFRSFYEMKQVDLDALTEMTGLNRRKTRLLLNFLADLGLSRKRSFEKTKLGQLVYNNDGYLQMEGTLWFFHYMIASNEYIVVWNRILNDLINMTDFDKEELYRKFDDLEEEISDYSFKKHIRQEVSSVIKTYTETLMQPINLIEEDYNDRYVVNKNPDIDDAILLACIYEYREKFFNGATALSIHELAMGPNGIARVFVLDEYFFREALERMKNKGWITIESRGNLDQIRLQDGDCSYDAMTKYYTGKGI